MLRGWSLRRSLNARAGRALPGRPARTTKIVSGAREDGWAREAGRLRRSQRPLPGLHPVRSGGGAAALWAKNKYRTPWVLLHPNRIGTTRHRRTAATGSRADPVVQTSTVSNRHYRRRSGRTPPRSRRPVAAAEGAGADRGDVRHARDGGPRPGNNAQAALTSATGGALVLKHSAAEVISTRL